MTIRLYLQELEYCQTKENTGGADLGSEDLNILTI